MNTSHASTNVAGVQITVWPSGRHIDRWQVSLCKGDRVEHHDVGAATAELALDAAARLLGVER